MYCKFALLFLLACFPQDSKLTNGDVVKMLKDGLSPEVVAAKIKATPNQFDTSPEELKKLKDAGVPDSVILVMLEPPKPTVASDESAHNSIILMP